MNADLSSRQLLVANIHSPSKLYLQDFLFLANNPIIVSSRVTLPPTPLCKRNLSPPLRSVLVPPLSSGGARTDRDETFFLLF